MAIGLRGPIRYGRPLPETNVEALLDMWYTKFEDKTIVIENAFRERTKHPDWIVEQVLRALTHMPCQANVVSDTMMWTHRNFYISAHESFGEQNLHICIRPIPKGERN